MPNGEWLGKVWMPLNEFGVMLRSANTLNRLWPHRRERELARRADRPSASVNHLAE